MLSQLCLIKHLLKLKKNIPEVIEKQNQVDLTYFPVEVQKKKDFTNFYEYN